MPTHITVTPEESAALAQMLRSEGWRLVLKHLIIPELLRTNKTLDAPSTTETQTHLYRGVKRMLTAFLDTLYPAAHLRSPFQEQLEAFLVTLEPVETVMETIAEQPPSPPPEVRRRVARPVL